MKLHLKSTLLAMCTFAFCTFSVAQQTADYPDNAGGPGLQNVRVGFRAGDNLNGGDRYNTFTGAFSGASTSSLGLNSYYGFNSGFKHKGEGNTFLGAEAGSSASGSEYSTYVGYAAGSGTDGGTNIFIGPKAGSGLGTVSNQLYIGISDNPLIYGDMSDDVVGINTISPLATLDVRGTNMLLTDVGTNFGNFANSRAAAIGQSGGPGGGACNLYGFRSQTDVDNAINVGMNGTLPTILWGRSGGAKELTFAYSNGPNTNPCSSRILRLGRNVSGYQFFLEGSGRVNGSWLVLSDKRLKKDVKTIGNAMDLITQLNGVTYNYDLDKNPDMILPTGKTYGFIAQEVQAVIPEVTATTEEDGLVGIRYTELIPVLTEGIKEQQEVIEAQEEVILDQQTQLDDQAEEITTLKDRLAAIEQMLGAQESVDVSSVTLSQNRPNPFSDVTTIEYEIPAATTDATLDVFDMSGRLIDSYNIQGGKGTVDFNSKTLPNGTYVYAINMGGANVATNIMIVQK